MEGVCPPRSEYLGASLRRGRAAPPAAGAVLPLQWFPHHAPLLPECALDSLQSQGPDFNGTGERRRGKAADTWSYPQTVHTRG